MENQVIKKKKKRRKIGGMILIVVDGPDCMGKESFTNFVYAAMKKANIGGFEHDSSVKYNDDYPTLYLDMHKYTWHNENKWGCESAASNGMERSFRYKVFHVDKRSFPNYETESGKRIKELLYSEQTPEVVTELEQLFVDNIAEGMEEYRTLVKERSARGEFSVLICDRYIYSNFVYMWARYGKEKALEFMTPHAQDLPLPDCVVTFRSGLSRPDWLRCLKNCGNLDNNEKDTSFMEKVDDIFEYITDRTYEKDYVGYCNLYDGNVDWWTWDSKIILYNFGFGWWKKSDKFGYERLTHFICRLIHRINQKANGEKID